MQFKTPPWPLSELTPEEARKILALPAAERAKRLSRLVQDIKSGEHARRERWRKLEQNL